MTPDQFSQQLALFTPEATQQHLTITKEQQWMAVSQLQKAIRRGLPDHAALWIHALWDCSKATRAYGLFRMAVIAAEEIAGANPALAARFMETEIKKDWFDAHGVKAAMFFAREFALSPKDRSSCDLAGISKRAGAAPARLKGSWKDASSYVTDMDSLSAMALDSSLDLRAREVALWMLAGTSRIPAPAEMIPTCTGDLSLFLHTCKQLCPDEDLNLVIQKSLKINKEPNPIGLALCRHYAVSENAQISSDPLFIDNAITDHVLLAGLDMHTREGQKAISSWLQSSEPLKRLLKPISSWKDKNALLGYLLFRAEGHDVTSKLDYQTAQQIQLWCQTGLSDAIERDHPEPVFRGLKMLLPALQYYRKEVLGLLTEEDLALAQRAAPSAAKSSSTGQNGHKGSFKGI